MLSGATSLKFNENTKNKVRMVRYQRLWPYKCINSETIRYGWCSIRGYYPIQVPWNTKKIRYGWCGIRDVNPINASTFTLECHWNTKIRYGRYVVKTLDPLNALKLNKKVRVVRHQRLPLCNFIKVQQISFA